MAKLNTHHMCLTPAGDSQFFNDAKQRSVRRRASCAGLQKAVRDLRPDLDDGLGVAASPACANNSWNRCADLLFLIMERKDNEQTDLPIFLVEKLGRGIRIMSGNVETPKLPRKMKELLARLAKAPLPRK